MAVGQANNSANTVLTMLKSPDVQFALALICIIFMLFIPLPPLLLDVLLSLSITIGFLVLLIAIYIKEPLDFSTFPTFLLLATLFRLALNVATTRNILLEGASGEVSNVISSFGNFVVGGNQAQIMGRKLSHKNILTGLISKKKNFRLLLLHQI